MEKELWKHILAVRAQSPLVHNITNYVVMNNTANALLAIGASPIMAHASSEVKEMVSLSHSLVINIGTLDEYWAESMLIAAQEAHARSKPWVLDPVGAGATPYRDSILKQLLLFKPTAVRGNASEIMALASANQTVTKGVDSTANSPQAIVAAKRIVNEYGSVVCITGETDIIISNGQQIAISNGHAMMTKVTGLGCTATALIGAFIGVIEDKTAAVAAAMSLLGIAGELAAKTASGPGSLQYQLLDKLYNITGQEFTAQLDIAY